jgi:hypothetical protein
MRSKVLDLVPLHSRRHFNESSVEIALKPVHQEMLEHVGCTVLCSRCSSSMASCD